MNRFAPLVVFLPGCLCGWPEDVGDGTPTPPDPTDCEVDADLDDDGFDSPICGGHDCNDQDPSIHPGATEAEAGGWIFETLERAFGGEFFQEIAAVGDSVGRIHLAFSRRGELGGGALFYAVRDGVWQSLAVDEAYAFFDDPSTGIDSASIATGPDGLARLAWIHDGTAVDGSLHVLSAVGGLDGFDQSEIETSADSGSTGIAVDVGGETHVVYPDGGVVHAEEIGDSWLTQTISSNGEDPSIAIAGSTVLVVYRVGTELRVARSTESGWEEQSAGTTSSPLPPWIGVDGFGVAHLVFAEAGTIRHADDHSGEWSEHEEIAAGSSPTAAIDLAGKLRIAYLDSGEVLVAVGRAGDWQTESLLAGTGRAAIALTPDGSVTIAMRGTDCPLEDPYQGSCSDALVAASSGPMIGGVDRNCDGIVEEPSRCADDDDDGQASMDCGGTDCDDASAQTFIGAADPFGDGVDTDCDGQDGVDRDADGYATREAGGDDCDDRRAAVHPGAPEIDDCVDDDCDGLGGPDGDGDGHAAAACAGDDCDDANALVFPGAIDPRGDGEDVDCDGVDGTDGDADGHASIASGGDDCDDTLADLHPGAPDGERVWRTDSVEGGAWAGTFDSLALDPDGAVHMAYLVGEAIHHATNASGAWDTESAAAAPGTNAYSSLAIDADGAVHIAYRSHDDSELRHATNTSGAWDDEVIDAEGSPGWSTTIAVDSAGGLHVVYWDIRGDMLSHATNSSGDWVIETFARDCEVWHSDSAIDADDVLHLVYEERLEEDLVYAKRSGGVWQTEIVDGGADVGYQPSIAIDEAGVLHVSYRTGADSRRLRYATNAGGVWSTEEVDPGAGAGEGSAIGLDPEGGVHIAYAAAGELRHAVGQSGDWTIETIDDEGGSYVTLGVDDSGSVHVGYEQGDAMYATDEVLPDGVDQNCDGVDGVDADGDGHASTASGGDDCDDADDAVQAC